MSSSLSIFLYNDAKVLIQSSFRCECVGWKTCTLRRDLSSSSYVPGVSPADMICPYCPTASPSPNHTKNGLSPLSTCPTPPHDKKTDYLSALYMQHGSKPQESLSPAALYSHDDTWGKGKGGAVRRKNTARRGTTVTRRWKSGRKSNRELQWRRGAGCQA